MTTSTTETSRTDITAGDMFLTLNGFDELAVAKAFAADIADLRNSPMRFLRALAFVHQRRGGAKDADAYKTAMTLTVSEVGDYFADDPDDDSDASALIDDGSGSAEGNDDEPSSS